MEIVQLVKRVLVNYSLVCNLANISIPMFHTFGIFNLGRYASF